MSENQHGPAPVEIQLHQRRRTLELTFEDGAHYELPCEYLRVFSPSAEVKAAHSRGEWVTGKSEVNIAAITPIGSYAVQLHFDDGHDSGVYSWATLYELGRRQQENWRRYEAATGGLARSEPAVGPISLKVLYFVGLVEKLGRESEQVEVPPETATVEGLVAWLRKRGPAWERALGERPLKIAVNKQLADPKTPLRPGDEIAIVPTAAPGAEA